MRLSDCVAVEREVGGGVSVHLQLLGFYSNPTAKESSLTRAWGGIDEPETLVTLRVEDAHYVEELPC